MNPYLILVSILLTISSLASDPKKATSSLPKVPSDRIYARRDSIDEEHKEALEKIVSFREPDPAGSEGRVRGGSAPTRPVTTQDIRRPHAIVSDTRTPHNTNRVLPGRSIPFEPHLRRLEDDVIRQMHFRVKIRTEDDGTIKLSIYGYLRDRRVMKQRIDLIS